MQLTLTPTNCTLIRDKHDKRISHESTTAYHIKEILNSQGYHLVRFNPSKHGLTACTVGLIDRKAHFILWHERYAIEDAAKAFNAGKVTFERAEE